jgi:flagellar protein FliS
MEARGYQNYKEQTLSTMTQGELLNLLLDELVKRTIRCGLELEQQNYAQFEATADRCIAIINYLDNTLDFRYEISRELHRLYDFFCYDFNRVKIGRNAKELERLRPLIVDLRDTFRSVEQSGADGQREP